jgi:F0F1-type ATP synthase membrane subunit b/b'
MDMLRLLDQLNDLAVEQPRQLVGRLYWGLDTDEISMQISKIRSNLPQEMKDALHTRRESERILENAQEDAGKTLEKARADADEVLAEARREAERIIEEARIQQERMIADHEILKLTKAQSEEIRNSADRDAIQMRRGAEKYAFDVLSQLEGVVGKVMTTIERGKLEVAPRETSPLPAVPPRERTRV